MAGVEEFHQGIVALHPQRMAKRPLVSLPCSGCVLLCARNELLLVYIAGGTLDQMSLELTGHR